MRSRPPLPGDPLPAALRLFQQAVDRLKHAEAKIEVSVKSNFLLGADWKQQARALLLARRELADAVQDLANAVYHPERQADANVESPETEEREVPASACHPAPAAESGADGRDEGGRSAASEARPGAKAAGTAGGAGHQL